jgi:hypothetical protein
MKYSYSILNAYENCPKQFYEVKILKSVPYIQSTAAAWGSAVHEYLDKFFKTGELSERFEFVMPTAYSVLKAANGAKIETERELGIDENKQPCGFWSGKVRGKQDLFYKVDPERAVLLDWKVSAKPNPSRYKTELDVFCYLSYANDPELQKIKTGLIWLHQEAPHKPTMGMSTRDDMSRLEDVIFSKIERIEEALENENFPAKPSGLCGWCEIKSCRHWKPRR